MSSAEDIDVGLLAPVWAGTAAERLTSDTGVLAAMVRAEAALLHALAGVGIAPPEVLDAVDVLEAATLDARKLALAASKGGNPVIPLVQELRGLVGEDAAGWVHHGATSQDIVDTAMMLVAADVCSGLRRDLGSLADTLARVADTSRAVPLAARTLTQQALPTTLGMRVAGWLAGVNEALLAVQVLHLPASLGGPVGTAAAYGERGPDVLDVYADRLDLAAPLTSWHTNRAPVVALGDTLMLAGAACGKITADLLVMSQSEVGEVREGVPGPSSAMPHKANPAQSVLVASAARQLPALLATLASNAMPANERPAGAWHAEWQPLRSALRLAGAAAERTSAMVPGVEFDHTSMARNLDQLLHRLGEDRAWAARQTAHVDVWIDRVLSRHDEIRSDT